MAALPPAIKIATPSAAAAGAGANNTTTATAAATGLSTVPNAFTSSGTNNNNGNNNMSQNDDKRTSLFDVIRENLTRIGKTSILYRVVVCGRLANPKERSEFGTYYQKFFKQYQNDTDLITGILLIFPNVWIHVLEATSKVVTAYLRDLDPSSSSSSVAATAAAAATDSKLLHMSDDVGARAFPFWACRLIDPIPSLTAFYVDEAVYQAGGEALAAELADISIKLCNLGTGLSSLQKQDLKTALDEMPYRYKDLIPRVETSTCGQPRGRSAELGVQPPPLLFFLAG
ncbi:hypothetical protein DFJ73DRAFT_324866 [Zopfochytrium polystomum]|nr:hypothetical protein DFJ73DRAFT_324866 [Zopfochytrium polystomum]